MGLIMGENYCRDCYVTIAGTVQLESGYCGECYGTYLLRYRAVKFAEMLV